MHRLASTGATPSGQVYVTPEGNVAIYQGLKAAVTGDLVEFENNEIYNFTNNSITWTEGQTVYFDGTNVAATGFIRIGKCVAATASSVSVVPVRLLKDARESHYTQAAAGTALTNTVTATTMTSAPAIPANYLQAGDKIKIRGQIIVTSFNSTNTLAPTLQFVGGTSGTNALVAPTAYTGSANDIMYFDAEAVVRTTGATGTLIATGIVATGASGTVTTKAWNYASATFDTTQTQTPGITGTWSVANASNSARVDIFDVDLVRA